MDPNPKPTKEQLSSHEFIKNQPISLELLVQVLENAFTRFENTMKSITLAIGYTGCGKSTLL